MSERSRKMSKAMNGKNFERQFFAASVKLGRAVESNGADPVSGFSTDAIVEFLIQLPELGDNEQMGKVKSVLRRNELEQGDELEF